MLTEAGDDLRVVDRRADGHLQLFPDVVQRTHVLESHVRHRREALSERKEGEFRWNVHFFQVFSFFVMSLMWQLHKHSYIFTKKLKMSSQEDTHDIFPIFLFLANT